MKYRNLGRTGLKVSALCLGTMQFGWTADEELSFQILNEAYQSGIILFDTADVYSRWVDGNPGGVSETIIGNWIKRFSIPRDQILIATKVRAQMGRGPNDEGLSRAHIFHAVEASLRRLKTDYIDLYQTHWFDDQTPIDETLSALDDLVRQGKVRYIGCSNYPAWRLMQALWRSDSNGLVRFDSLQPHYNLVHREEFERELKEVCTTYGLGVIPYSPLAGGFLTGKYRQDRTDVGSVRQSGTAKYFTAKNWKLLDVLDEIVLEKGNTSVSQISLAWLLHQSPITSPIIGPRNLDQLKDNLAAVDLELNQEDLTRLNDASL